MGMNGRIFFFILLKTVVNPFCKENKSAAFAADKWKQL